MQHVARTITSWRVSREPASGRSFRGPPASHRNSDDRCAERGMNELDDDVRIMLPIDRLAEWPDAAVIFLTTFRCWLAGYETGDVACWELGWKGASRLLPLRQTKRLIAEISHFTRVFRDTLARRFTFLPYCCGRATPEECLAVQLVAAAQRGALAAAGRLAHQLTGADDHVALVDAAAEVGAALRESELTLALPSDPGDIPARRGVLH
jgi:hypothetical protein